MIQQPADRLIEPQQQVLDLVAPRTVGVADEVERREADGEVVHTIVLPQFQRVHGGGRHPPEIRVRERRALPAAVERRAGSVAGFPQLVRECSRHARPGPLGGCVVFVLIVAGVEQPRPRVPGVGRHGVRVDEPLEERHRRLGERCRRRPSAALVEPHHRVGAVADERDRRTRLERHRHGAPAFRLDVLAECGDEHAPRAVALSALQPVVADLVDRAVVGAIRRPVRGAIRPRVENHAVPVGERTGADRRVPRARHGVEVRIGGLREPGPLLHEPFEAAGEAGAVAVEIVGAHLIDHEHHDQLR